jgi:hypothetical protein
LFLGDPDANFFGKRSAGQKAVEKTGKERPWKSLRDFHFSHSFNNNKLDDRDHFLENATASVASLRRLIGSTRNTDRDQIGMLIGFVGIPSVPRFHG